MTAVIRSVYEDQDSILDAIEVLYCPNGFQCDLTFGNGQFWKSRPLPEYCFDLDDTLKNVTIADSGKVPLAAASLNNVVFDPPFLTYVRAGREGNGKMTMARRFGGYWTYEELTKHYQGTLLECARILKKGGILIFKCQDIVHNHRLHPTHIHIVRWAEDAGFKLKDIFVLVAKHRMPSPNRKGNQKHARIFHSYFLVFENCNQAVKLEYDL